MMKTVDRRRFLAGSGVSAGAALLWRQSAWASSPAVETAYVNAKVWTGQGCRIFSDAIGVSGTRIVALGEDAVRAGSDRRTRIVDLDGAFVTPGFIDSHVHFVMASLQLGQPSLRDAADRADFERRIAGAARDLPAGQWLTGGNWDNDRWGGELPDRGWIDAATPHTPVAVVRYDLHMVLLNSRALDMLGIVPGIADVDGGVIGRDAAGRLTGIFKDAAKDMVMDRIPPASEAAIDAACRRGMALALGKGAEVVVYEGLSSLSDAPVALFTRTFPAALLPHLGESLAAGGSVTEALAANGVPDYIRRDTRITAEAATPTQALHLRVREGAPVLRTVAVNTLLDGTPIEYGVSFFAGERIALTVALDDTKDSLD